MILYVNGDSHAAGAEIHDKHLSNYSRDEIDRSNIESSFGYLLAKKLGYDFITDAQSGASNDRIYRTTKEYLEKNNHNVFVLIGWSTTDRREVLIDNKYYSFSPGLKINDTRIKKEFKKYILSLDHDTLIKQNYEWHEKIYNFHKELDKKNIPHLFFNTYTIFNNVDHPTYQKIFYDWNYRMIGPYKDNETYYYWLKNDGYFTVNTNSHHYGEDAHKRWANRLYNWLTHHQLL